MGEDRLTIRDARPEDAPALAEIYGWHVRHGTGSFEETPPDAAEMAARLGRVRAAGLPYLVAELEGALVGYACAAPYNARSGYRFTAEDSVYVAAGREGRGVGRALLSRVVEACGDGDVRRLVAFIGDSANLGSIALHRGLGFRPAGVLQQIGYKQGRWLDVVMMQRDLGSD